MKEVLEPEPWSTKEKLPFLVADDPEAMWE